MVGDQAAAAALPWGLGLRGVRHRGNPRRFPEPVGPAPAFPGALALLLWGAARGAGGAQGKGGCGALAVKHKPMATTPEKVYGVVRKDYNRLRTLQECDDKLSSQVQRHTRCHVAPPLTLALSYLQPSLYIDISN